MLDRTIAGLIEGQELLRLPGDTKVREAARQMSARHIGAILVGSSERDYGIFTERDMLDRVVAERPVARRHRAQRGHDPQSGLHRPGG